MLCDWNDDKNAINQRKHGLSFETTHLVFEDPNAITFEDFIDDNGEQRYRTIGLIGTLLVVVAHVFRDLEGAEIIWLISARKAVAYEEEAYFERS